MLNIIAAAEIIFFFDDNKDHSTQVLNKYMQLFTVINKGHCIFHSGYTYFDS